MPYDESYDDTEQQPPDDSSGEPYEEPPGGYDDSGAYEADPGAPPQEDASVDTFYDSLRPYGRWVRSPSYGLIWVPSRSVVGAAFVPYSSNGQWQYTDVGWMFQSDWNWGWAPFHYGRWYRDTGYGWVWVPGSTWAPAWVDWRFGGDVVGWAPLAPRHHRTVWTFANARDLNRRDIRRYVIRNPGRYYRSTRPVRYRVRSGRSYWFSGPRGASFERAARFKVRPIRVRPPRAGIVARVRLQGGRVHNERIARPRHREITQSRRELPARTRRPGAPRPDVRRPGVGRPDPRRPDPRRPDPRRPDVRRPDVRDRQAPPRGREVRERPQPRSAPPRGHEVRERPQPQPQPQQRQAPPPRGREVRERPQPQQQPQQRQAPPPRGREVRERPAPRVAPKGRPAPADKDKDKDRSPADRRRPRSHQR
ncbi:MAG TPA: DUF6600 domain-containing protein [Kofleriaceae bacterium]|nr:DUF6600 domain-containing protein [Kofleriaceae bacterium]